MYRKEIVSYLVSIWLVFLACLLHGLDFFYSISFPVHVMVFVLYSFVIFLWMRNMRNRVLRSAVVLRFKTIGILLIAYLAVRTVKYEIFLENEAAVRFIRYLYFVFPLVLTQLVFLTSLYVGKSERETISKFWNLLWLPTGLLASLIVSNNAHGLVFSLDPELRGLAQYGPVFYFVLVYIGLLALLTLVFTMAYSLKTGQLASAWLPILIIFIWGFYTFLYMTGWEVFEYFKIFFKSAEFNILMVVLFIESLVFMRLLPSNRGYESFLQLSSLNIGIMDDGGRMVFRPQVYKDLDPALIVQALDGPILVDEDTLLESTRIQGGISFYFIDLGDFNKLKRRLVGMGEDMLNENELLKAKSRLEKNMVRLEEQREIRDHIHRKLEPQFDQLKSILMNLPDEEDLFEIKLKHACFLDVYIKRYANLFLLTKGKQSLDLAELKLAFCESLDYLQLSGVKTGLDWGLDGRFAAQVCLDFYEFFQYALEFYMPGVDSVQVYLGRQDGGLGLRMDIIGGQGGSFLADRGCLYVQRGLSVREDILDQGVRLELGLEGGLL